MAVSLPGGVEQRALVALLADGRRHSGETLARALGVSRAAVWKGVERLRGRGIDIGAAARRGYALKDAVELLDEAAIRGNLAVPHAARVRRLSVEFEVDSTNSRLLAGPPPPVGWADVMLSELQNAGRGRRGRAWIAPFGGSIALSMGWSFGDLAEVSPSLSLCVGVALTRALDRVGAVGVGLKWPNDLWFEDRKLGGVLIDMRGEAGGPAYGVIGVGLNVTLTPSARAGIEAAGGRVAAVADACPLPPSRNRIAGALIDELLRMLAEFEQAGFAAFRAEWSTRDALCGRAVRVLAGDATVSGTARGVDAEGRLLLERAGGVQPFMSGDVSLRLEIE